MKAIWSVVGAGVMVFASACSSSSSSGGGGKTVSSGSYTVSNGALGQNDCGFTASFYGGTAFTTVTVTVPGLNGGGTMDVAFPTTNPFTESYTITGAALHDDTGSGQQDVDCSVASASSATLFSCGTTTAFSCGITISQDFAGTITAHNKFSLQDTYGFLDSTALGACPAAVITTAFGGTVASLPCTTIDGGDFQ